MQEQRIPSEVSQEIPLERRTPGQFGLVSSSIPISPHPGVAQEQPPLLASPNVPVSEYLMDRIHRESAEEEEQPSDLGGINLDKLATLLEESKRLIKEADGRRLIAVIGRTGAGKSTLVNYLMGQPLRILVNRGGSMYLDIEEGETAYTSIGHGIQAETLHPVMVPITEIDGLAYCDLPGFNDNRSVEEKLCSGVAIPMTLHYARGICGIVVVINIEDFSARSEHFTQLIKSLRGLINLDQLEASQERSLFNTKQIIFVFSRVDERLKKGHIVGKIEIYRDWIIEDRKKFESEITEVLEILDIPQLQQGATRSQLADTYRSIEKKFLNRGSSERTKSQIQRILSSIKKLDCTIQELAMLNLILSCQDRFFIFRGDNLDDRAAILECVTHFHDYSVIPKNQFRVGCEEEIWTQLDKVLRSVSRKIGKMIKDQETCGYREHIDDFEFFDRLYYQDWQGMLSILRKNSGNLESGDLIELSHQCSKMEHYLCAYTKTEIDKTDKKINQFCDELKSLDTQEEVPFLHPSLERVKVESSQLRRVGGAITGAVLMVPLILLTAPFAMLHLGFDRSVRLLRYAGLLKKMDEEADGSYVANPVVWGIERSEQIAEKIAQQAYRFRYHGDRPFVRAILKTDPPQFSGQYLGFDHGKYGSGFDIKNRKERKKDGIYEITFFNSEDHPITAWVELYVEKRMHPDFLPRINDLKDLIIKAREEYNELKEIFLKKITISNQKWWVETSSTEFPGRVRTEVPLYEARIRKESERLWGIRASFLELEKKIIRQHSYVTNIVADIWNIVFPESDYMARFMETYQEWEQFRQENGYFLRPNPRKIPVWREISEKHEKYNMVGGGISEGVLEMSFQYPDVVAGLLARARINLREKRDNNLCSLLEKLAADFYLCLSEKYIVPNTHLALLSVSNVLMEIPGAPSLNPIINNQAIYVISECKSVAYQEVAELVCIAGEEELTFEECLHRQILPKEAFVDGRPVLIHGLIELLAVGTLLADSAVLGRNAKNVCFLVERNIYGIATAVRIIKIDCGQSFNFDACSLNIKSLWTGMRDSKGDLIYIPLESLSSEQKFTFFKTMTSACGQLLEGDLIDYLSSRPDLYRIPRYEYLAIPSMRVALSQFKVHLVGQRKLYQQELEEYALQQKRMSRSSSLASYTTLVSEVYDETIVGEPRPTPAAQAHPHNFITATLPSGKLLELMEGDVARDGNCAVNALGTDRATIAATLLTLADEPAIRERFLEEIRELMESESEIPAEIALREILQTEEFFHLRDEYVNSENELSRVQRELVENHPELGGLTPRARLSQLPEGAERDTLNQTILEEGRAKEALTLYYQREEVFRTYVTEGFGRELWLSYEAIIQFARRQNISVYIFEHSELNPQQLVIRNHLYCECENPLNIIYILHTEGYSHFNILFEPTMENQQINQNSTLASGSGLTQEEREEIAERSSQIGMFAQSASQVIERRKLKNEDYAKDFIPKGYTLGSAQSRGDCFFDAVAQALMKISSDTYNVKSLRLLCREYVQDPSKSWVGEAINQGREISGDYNYEEWLARIAFTAEEMDQANQDGLVGEAVWGRPHIEGQMLCAVLGIRIHLIEILDEDDIGAIHLERPVMEQLITSEGLRASDSLEQRDRDADDLIHVACYRHHFVPLYTVAPTEVAAPIAGMGL